MDGGNHAGLVSNGCFDFGDVDVEAVGFDVDKHRRGTETDDRADCAEESVGGGDHFVALANPHRHHRHNERVGAGGDADSVLGLAIVGGRLLEAFDCGAEDEVLRGNDLSDSGIELWFERFVLWFEIEERN